MSRFADSRGPRPAGQSVTRDRDIASISGSIPKQVVTVACTGETKACGSGWRLPQDRAGSLAQSKYSFSPGRST